jgi:pSer/pThr/pTyr-binding forkhead associated (FHA) protein
VDLGSANGTFVNDQMVNTSLVHNNDVIRFGKYTLWVGYEADRRSAERSGPVVSAVSDTMGHTVVLSRAEIGSILEQERRSGSTRVVAVQSPAAPASPHVVKRAVPAWIGIALGVLVGLAIGAVVLWLVLQRPTLS